MRVARNANRPASRAISGGDCRDTKFVNARSFFLAIVFKNSHRHAPVMILRADSWNRQLEFIGSHITHVSFFFVSASLLNFQLENLFENRLYKTGY